ncbi:hypothetical protein O6H91_15G023200 [Diphasiastrum complanatum]|uniref:Uncharacterized protein n=1 Tax=Diphasiastrum complanatum TaxID=34168 RepID=A0ACC2BHH4_DIPCM|nr:hypothetical protein O6H91_15G023200 [Diphasiastrum complanatum]
MEKLAALEATASSTAWNYCGERLAVGTGEGAIQVWEKERGGGGSSFSCIHKWQAYNGPVVKIIWGSPEYGDVVASSSTDGNISLWEEIEENDQSTWRKCTQFEEPHTAALDFQFGNCLTGLKLVVAWADGRVKVYDMLDTLDLKQWQLQADFLNDIVVDGKSERRSYSAASIAWRPPVSSIQQPIFALAYRSNSLLHNVAKVWEFLDAYQRWSPVAELRAPGEEGDSVNSLSWATNIGRPYELIAVGSSCAVLIWHLEFSQIAGEKPIARRVARLTEHNGMAS